MKKTLLGVIILFLTEMSGTADYLIGPGDVLRIDVLEEEQLSGRYTVSSKGTIQMFLLGEINVVNLTTDQLAEKLKKELEKDYLRNPQIKVIVEEFNSHKIFVLGEVAKPGTYHLKGKNNILDILLEAGGPTQNAGDQLSILRTENKDGQESLTHIPVNVTKLFISGDMSQNVGLKDNDIIYMSRRERGDITSRFFQKEMNTFSVVGEVKKPGAYEYREGYTVLNAILDAGGLTEYASPNRTKLVRGEGEQKETIKIKLGDIIEKGKKELDRPIQPGDLIIVPASLF
jgi:polysaccharide export outer membrane protein